MIALLSPEVRDQIAAGEVVERPAHMVKELMENSLDAGSTEIMVRVKHGGRYVEVQDNGHGIKSEELSLALDRFATSKIRESDDLWRLKTFGFRGEALASLAAVSELTLISRTKKDKTAFRIKSKFGAKTSVNPISGEVGTKIVIENLFENVPARLKFLKSESAENQAIRQIIKALALANPSVEFKYFEDDKMVLLFQKADSALKRTGQVLDLPALHSAQDQAEGWKVDIHFAAPDQVGKTSRNIWVFVQGRFVQDRALQTAMTDAYRSLLMHGEYPVCVAQLWVPEDQVDVNIHPTKSQVKFVDSSKAFRFVHHALRRALETAPWIPTQPELTPEPVAQPYFQPKTQMPEPQPLRFQDQAFDTTSYRKKDMEWGRNSSRVEDSKVHVSAVNPEASSETTVIANPEVSNSIVTQSRVSQSPQAEPSLGYWSRLQVVGQVGLTYIVAQDESRMMLVDQHAAHERVAFERLMKAWNGGRVEIQDFLFPLAIDLSAAQVEAVMLFENDLKKLGVSIEQLGPSTLGIKSAPAFVKDSVFTGIIEKMADEILDKGGSFQFEKKVVDICATIACHSVVRAGQSLSIEEMRALLRQMDEFPLSSFCPHGRPVSIEWGFEKLEKDFGRRV